MDGSAEASCWSPHHPIRSFFIHMYCAFQISNFALTVDLFMVYYGDILVRADSRRLWHQVLHSIWEHGADASKVSFLILKYKSAALKRKELRQSFGTFIACPLWLKTAMLLHEHILIILCNTVMCVLYVRSQFFLLQFEALLPGETPLCEI